MDVNIDHKTLDLIRKQNLEIQRTPIKERIINYAINKNSYSESKNTKEMRDFNPLTLSE